MPDKTMARLEAGHVIKANPYHRVRTVLYSERLAGGTVRVVSVQDDGKLVADTGSPRSRLALVDADPVDLAALARLRGGYDNVPPPAQLRLRQLAGREAARGKRP